jgi:membrane protease YdiL (CAAX protease family)
VKREWPALIFAMTFPTVMTWLYFVVLARPISLTPIETHSFSSGNNGAQVAYAAGKTIQFSFPLLYLVLVDPSSLHPRRPNFKGMGLGVAFGFLVGLGLVGLYLAGLQNWLAGTGTATMIRLKIEEFDAASPARYVALASFLAVAHSLLEEYYWRWFVFGRLRRLISLPAAIALSSLAFMAHHVVVLGRFFPHDFWSAAVPFSICVGVGGAFWAWLYDRSGSVYAPWISHLLVDAAIMMVGYDMVFNGLRP